MNTTMLFLYGPSGAGKTTTGKFLAGYLELPFYDLDSIIVKQSQMTVGDIFAAEGETGFRQRERAELRILLAHDSGVIALGGGALLDPENRSLAEAHGPVVLLNAPLEVLARRLSASKEPRPLLAEDFAGNLARLLASRAGHYASFPLQQDSTNLSPDQAAWEIQVKLGLFHVQDMSASGAAPNRAYDVLVQAGCLDSVGELLTQRRLNGPMIVVSDTNTGPLYAPRVVHSLQKAGYTAHTALFPSGEQHKTIHTVGKLWEAFLANGMERGSTIIALGGGVVSDLAGFAAATFLRGVPWVVLPTTLLAMADASLGGKTGADLPQGKNLIGAFYAPCLVAADPQTLATLPEGELRSGLAEVVKHGVISDPALFARCAELQGLSFEQLKETPKGCALDDIVRRAMAVKIQVIDLDPFEKGRRAVLNFGHTIGHAVELASGFRLRHGEAVAIGMVAETRLAEQIGLAEAGLNETISGVLRGLGLPVEIPPGMALENILKAIGTDKKRAGGKVRFALPVKIGEVKEGIVIDSHSDHFDFGRKDVFSAGFTRS